MLWFQGVRQWLNDEPSHSTASASRPHAGACAAGSFAIENRLARPVQIHAFHPSQKGFGTMLTLQPNSVWSVPGFLYPTAYRVARRHLVQNPKNPSEWILEDQEEEEEEERPPPGASADKKLRRGETSVKVLIPAGIEPGDRVVFTVGSDDRQFRLEVPGYIKRRKDDELQLMVAIPARQALAKDDDAEETEPETADARVMYVEPQDEFIYSFIVDPSGDVLSGLIQLTETGARLQPCSRDPPFGAVGQTRFEWNATTVEMKSYKQWSDLNRAF